MYVAVEPMHVQEWDPLQQLENLHCTYFHVKELLCCRSAQHNKTCRIFIAGVLELDLIVNNEICIKLLPTAHII